MADIFLSYVQEDGDIAREVASGLEDAGYAVWYYERDSLPGHSYLDQILHVLDQAQAVVVIISSATLGSPQVNIEITEAHTANKPFVPLLRDLNYPTLVSRRRSWTMMFGTAVAAPIPTEGVPALMPRIVRGLQALAVVPGKHAGGDATASAEPSLRSASDSLSEKPTDEESSPAGPHSRDYLLDIARVVAFPTDFGDQLRDLEGSSGRYRSLESRAKRSDSHDSAASAAARQRKLDHGWRQSYMAHLSRDRPDCPQGTDIWIQTTVTEYASARGALREFDAITPDEDIVEFPPFGDALAMPPNEQILEKGRPTQLARYVYCVGPLLVQMNFYNHLNQPPDHESFAMAAQQVAARAAEVVARNTVPLSAMALRFEASSDDTSLKFNAEYSLAAGIPHLFGFLDDRATRKSRTRQIARWRNAFAAADVFDATTRGTIGSRDDHELQALCGTHRVDVSIARPFVPNKDQFPLPIAVIDPVGSGDGAKPEMGPLAVDFRIDVSLIAFPSEANADASIRDVQAWEADSAASTKRTITFEPDAPALGDNAVTFATTRVLGTGEAVASGFRIYARRGAIVAVVELVSIPEASLEDAVEIMSLQLDCIIAPS